MVFFLWLLMTFSTIANEVKEQTTIHISQDRELVSRQISFATIAFTGIYFDHTNTGFPGESLLDKLTGTNLPESYLAAIIFTHLHNVIEDLDRTKFGLEYDVMTAKIDKVSFFRKYCDLCSRMGLINSDTSFISNLVQSDRIYITLVLAITSYMILFLKT